VPQVPHQHEVSTEEVIARTGRLSLEKPAPGDNEDNLRRTMFKAKVETEKPKREDMRIERRQPTTDEVQNQKRKATLMTWKHRNDMETPFDADWRNKEEKWQGTWQTYLVKCSAMDR
jgi:hypothetical protein